MNVTKAATPRDSIESGGRLRKTIEKAILEQAFTEIPNGAIMLMAEIEIV